MNVGRIIIYNKTLTNANTEYSQALTSFTSRFQIKSRDPNADIKMSFNSGESGSTYWTVFGGSSDEEKGVYSGVRTIYMQSTTAGAVVEIIEFVS